jgi:glycosyltransferase involved in cell wall biosynthesis
MLSAVIITFNEERNIGRCLDSLRGVADDIVVLDSFSTDRTAEICREKGARFFQHNFDGHIEQKNRALGYARYDRVLALDADEALDETLRQSILGVKNNWTSEAYSMNRLTNYCGQWIRHSGWYPDRKVRLFDRRTARWGGVNPHDKVIVPAGDTVQQLCGDLLHFSYYTVEEHRARARRYAEIGAQAMFKNGQRGAWFRMLFSPVVKFIRNYFLKRGFLDGRAGWTICSITAWETYWKYKLLAKLNASRPVSGDTTP